MRYRSIPRCPSLKVSEIALGCEGFIGKTEEEFCSMWDKALELGINFIDMYTPDPEFRSHMGTVLRLHRSEIVLQGHVGTLWEDGQYSRTRDLKKTKDSFEDQLTRLGTDYLDIGMIHYCDQEADFHEVFDTPFIDYVKDLKAKGRIRLMGISSHNPVIARKAVETGLIDVLLFSVNAAYDMAPPDEDVMKLFEADTYASGFHGFDPDRKALYELCEREGVAINVMKAFGGGDMLDAELSPFGVAFTPEQCLEYCLTRPAVCAVNAGCHSSEEIGKLADYYEADAEQRDYSRILSQVKKFDLTGNCMYCGHCAPCSVGISVADVNKYMNLCSAQQMIPETVREHYKALVHHASECVSCGACEERCPFDVKIMDRMQRAEQLFGY